MASPATGTPSDQVMLPPGFHDLYEQYSDAVFRAALRVTGNPADAEDVLQTVFLKLLDSRLPLDPIRSPEPYLRRAATNASIDLLRKRSSQAETAIEEARDYGGREADLLEKERVRRALAKLAQEDAELFVLCYLEGYSYDELAEQFGIAKGTVASRLYRIREELQKSFRR
ncbi:MAG: sigma-70 family RNA polymerase sigma factor [Acidimicrobiia bacterium]|nr:sigma-70 family RNA polymerase sigma factor [Acidimicrobiia bacterium]